MIKTYRLRTKHRKAQLKVTETPTTIYANLILNKYGDYGDTRDLMDWLGPIFKQWDGDGRPIVMRHPLTGEVAHATDWGCVLVERGTN